MKSTEQNNIQSESKKKKIGRNFFNSFAMFFNHIAAIGLLISYFAPYVSPENFWFLAFFGLAYPVFVILNILFVIYWVGQLKRRMFYSLIILLGGWSYIWEYGQINFNNIPDKSKKTIKIMSYNVRLFDLYNWSNKVGTRNKMLELISDESPDIMCLQEFSTGDSTSTQFNNVDTLKKFNKAKNSYIEYTNTIRKKNHYGVAIFSAFPIIRNGKIIFDANSNNICIYSDIKINKDTVRVYNVHLQSIHLGYDDYKFMDDIMHNKKTEELEKSKNILKRIKRAFIKRSIQTELVAEHISKSPYPVIVCGDFNDPPASYTYHTISKDLEDAFVESGNGFGRTYAGKFPSFRIDYILHSKIFKAYDFRTIREELSDHFPVCCYLERQ
ncbi:MAG: endonuclease/exonuclease/phosphatase family protein [Bacteroidetes bacterium]|nr:endonuclease/exonuclease/phosphatase family protein [Bacteroidota bacterium]